MVIDQCTVESLPSGIEAQIIQSPALDGLGHLLPALVMLDQIDADVRGSVIQWLEQDPGQIGGLIATEAGPDELRHHLGRFLTVTLANDRRYLLRYYDPKVLCHLEWIMSAHMLRTWLGPMARWSYSLDSDWRHVTVSGSCRAKGLRFDRLQSDQLQRVSAINQVVEKLNLTKDGTRVGQAREISDYVARAQAYGWRDERDWVAFAALCVSHHAAIDSHQRMVQLINSLDAETAFADALALLTAEDIALMAADLTSNNVVLQGQ